MSFELNEAVQTVLELSPANKKKDALDKMIDIGGILFGGPLGTVASAASEAFQNYSLMTMHDQDVKLIKYLTDVEKLKISSETELKKAQMQQESLEIYIDRSFQDAIDEISKSYRKNLSDIRGESARVIREIDAYMQRNINKVNEYQRTVVVHNELACAAYREFLADTLENNVSLLEMASELIDRLIFYSDKFNNTKFLGICGVINGLTQPRDFLHFEDYIKINHMIRGV